MERFIHRENLKLFRQQLEATTDEARRRMLLRLLAEEEAKNDQLGDEWSIAATEPDNSAFRSRQSVFRL
jgi:hypothetical protein